MHVGYCRISLLLAENHSLKGKRQVSRSVIARVRNTFNVSVAEIEDNDLWQRLTLGVSCVSNSAPIVQQVLNDVVDFVERQTAGDAELMDHEIDMVSGV